MKHIIFSSLIGFALLTFTGCTHSEDVKVSKCQAKKCDKAKKESKKCQSSGKCSTGY
ncbi:MAG: hypothetical protein Q9M36_11940 [Sulfurovum sp.]|nr:hypothetical protein [Sulfurovum sp.]